MKIASLKGTSQANLEVKLIKIGFYDKNFRELEKMGKIKILMKTEMNINRLK